MGKLPGSMDGARFLRALSKFGWYQVRQVGSHRILEHAGTGAKLSVAFHVDIHRNSIRETLKKAGIDREAFLEIY